MNTNTTVKLPIRLAFVTGGKPGECVIKGTSGTHGDAGWTMCEIPAVDLQAVMRANAAAAMPCWRRLLPGGDLYTGA